MAMYMLCFQECKKSDEMQKVQLRSANDCQIVAEGMRVCGSIAVYMLCFQECKKSDEVQKVQLGSANDCEQVSEGMSLRQGYMLPGIEGMKARDS